MYLTELAEPTLLVIYPGRFQPWHRGHNMVYQYLTGKFGRNNVYIATSNKTDSGKSPFTFAEKAYFMQLTGVPADRIVQATQPYQIENVMQAGNIQVADPANTVVIFAVSEKDMAEDPRFSFAPKKDGSDPYFQPLKDIKQTVSMDKHGYIMTVPTFNFNVLNQPMQSGTELRNMYSEADEKQRQAIVTDLFGRYTREAEQIMNAKIPKEQPQTTGLQAAPEPVAEDSQVDPSRKNLLVKARLAHPFAKSDEEALALYISDKETQDFNNVEDEEHGLERRVDNIEQQLQKLLHKPVSEMDRRGFLKAAGAAVGTTALGGLTYHVAKKGAKEDKEFRHYVTDPKDIAKYEELQQNFNMYMALASTNKSYYMMSTQAANELDTFVKQMQKKYNFRLNEAGGTGVIANKKQAKDPRYSMSLTKDVRPGQINKSLKAFDLAEDLAWVKSRLGEGAVDELTARHIEYINQDIDALKQRISTEKLPAQYVEALKQKIAKLEAERAKLAF